MLILSYNLSLRLFLGFFLRDSTSHCSLLHFLRQPLEAPFHDSPVTLLLKSSLKFSSPAALTGLSSENIISSGAILRGSFTFSELREVVCVLFTRGHSSPVSTLKPGLSSPSLSLTPYFRSLPSITASLLFFPFSCSPVFLRSSSVYADGLCPPSSATGPFSRGFYLYGHS